MFKFQTIAEIYETDIADLEKCIQHYEQAADYFRVRFLFSHSELLSSIIPNSTLNIALLVNKTQMQGIHTFNDLTRKNVSFSRVGFNFFS